MSSRITTASKLLLVRAVDRRDDVVGGDRVDVVLELDREHARCRAEAPAASPERGGTSRRRDEKSPQDALFHRVRILSGKGRRPWPRRPTSCDSLPRPVTRAAPARCSPLRSRRPRSRAPSRRRSSRATLPLAAGARTLAARDAALQPRRASTGRGRARFASARAASPAAGAPGARPRPRTRTGPTAARWRAARSARGLDARQPVLDGPSDALEVRTSRRGDACAGALRLEPAGAVAAAHDRAGRRAADRPAALTWGANELIKRAPPRYAPALSFAVVHHTAGSNTYTRAQSAAIVTAIQLYHVQGNGWNDIGYNFLVDKYGQVFEGRFGGIEPERDRRPRGGIQHRLGRRRPARELRLGHRAERRGEGGAREGCSPGGSTSRTSTRSRRFNWLSGGNARFPRGVPVFLRAIVGHRDTGFTSCPGDEALRAARRARPVGRDHRAAEALRAVRARARRAARCASPRASRAPSRGRSRCSTRRAPTVAEGTGLGPTLDWTWDATSVRPGSYTWTIGGDGIRPATGSFGPRTVDRAHAHARRARRPSAVTPNGDGVDDTTSISYRLSLPATVTATLFDPAGTSSRRSSASRSRRATRASTFIPQSLADGTYRIRADRGRRPRARSSRRASTCSSTACSRASPPRDPAFSPNGDGRARHDRPQLRARVAGAGASCASCATGRGSRRRSPASCRPARRR